MKIFFKDSKGRDICGILSKADSEDAILILHGLGSTKDRPQYKILEKALLAKGFTSFRIDMFAHGESAGSYNDFTLSEAIDDVRMAVKYLKGLGYKRVGFIGASFGGLAGMMTSEDFSFMVLVSPVSHFDKHELLTRGIIIYRELKKHKHSNRRLGVKFFRDYWAYDHYGAASRVHCPVLIIHGDKDKVVPIEKSKMLKKSIKGSKLIVFKNTGHEYGHANGRLIELTVDYAESRKDI